MGAARGASSGGPAEAREPAPIRGRLALQRAAGSLAEPGDDELDAGGVHEGAGRGAIEGNAVAIECDGVSAPRAPPGSFGLGDGCAAAFGDFLAFAVQHLRDSNTGARR